MNPTEALQRFQAESPRFTDLGAIFPEATTYIPDGFKQNFQLACDAMPALMTAPNSAVPAYLTTLMDPTVYEVLFAPTKAAQIIGEVRKGTWLDETAMFPVSEHVGEVSSYGDYNENGHTGANINWPQRQSYLFQTMKEYGERELERAGLARINWVSEIDKAAASVMNKYANLTYFYGVQGLVNYGLLNDPGLSAALTPSLKAHGGVKWVINGVVVATANEIYTDIQSLFMKLVSQTAGLIDQNTAVTLALSPESSIALTATNNFNVNVSDLLKKNFPNIKIETAVQYGQRSAINPQGVIAGNMMQMIASSVEGQDTGFAAFNEKMRAHTMVRATSSFKQKVTGGTWGSVIRMPAAIASMIGI